jgi:flagellar protein FliO/FliZ
MIDLMNITYKIISLLADAAPEVAPAAPEALPSYEVAIVKMFLALLALVVGIIGTIWFLKRLSKGRLGGLRGGGSGRSIVILEKKALSSKTMLYVVEIEGKQALIAESQMEVRRIMTVEPMMEETESS